MGGRGARRARLVVALLVLASAVGCSGRGDDADREARRYDAGHGVIVESADIDGTVTARPVDGKQPAFGDLQPATAVYSVTVDGDFEGRATVELPVNDDLPDDAVLVGVTADDQGHWTAVPTKLRVVHGRVRIPTTHFSFFGALLASGRDLVDAVKKLIIDGASGGLTANASQPTCQDEEGARRDGYRITSDRSDTVYWCLGMEKGRRVLRVTNNRRYPLVVTHAHATVVDAGGLPDGFANTVSRWLSGNLTIVAPRATVTFGVDLEPDAASVQVQTQLDGLGQALYQLDVGIRSAVAIVTRFGLGAPDPSRDFDKYMDILGNWLTVGACADAVDEVFEDGATGGLFAACFTGKNLREAFGLKGFVLAPLMAGAALVEFFRSEWHTIIDQFTHRDRYRITVSRSSTTFDAPTLATLPVPSLCEHPAGRLVDGTLPGIPEIDGGVWAFRLGWRQQDGIVPELLAVGDLADGPGPEAVVTLACFRGGVSWPDSVHIYGAGPTHLATVDLTEQFDLGWEHREHVQRVRMGPAGSHTFTVDWYTHAPGDAMCCGSLVVRGTFAWTGRDVERRKVEVLQDQRLAENVGNLRFPDPGSCRRGKAPLRATGRDGITVAALCFYQAFALDERDTVGRYTEPAVVDRTFTPAMRLNDQGWVFHGCSTETSCTFTRTSLVTGGADEVIDVTFAAHGDALLIHDVQRYEDVGD